MIRCDNCGTNNLDGSEYCDECGMKLEMVRAAYPRSRRDEGPIFQPPSAVPNEPVRSNTMEGPLPSPPSFTTSTSIPKPALPARDRRKPEVREVKPSPRITGERKVGDFSEDRRRRQRSPQHTIALSSQGKTGDLPANDSGESGAAGRARLLVERGGRVGREFSITGIETNIGRWDADSGIFPDVDLDEDDPEAKISRRHARIISHNGQFYIEDLGSTNGTFVNRGRRLLPGKRHALQNGDEIIVGKTFLKFQLVK